MGPNKHYHDIFDTYEELSFQEYEDITTLLVEFGKRVNPGNKEQGTKNKD
jgi:aminopeptidase YwaD